MGSDPDVQLLEPRLQGLLEIADRLPVLRTILNVDTRSNKLVVL
jgi:hypothetical protein